MSTPREDVRIHYFHRKDDGELLYHAIAHSGLPGQDRDFLSVFAFVDDATMDKFLEQHRISPKAARTYLHSLAPCFHETSRWSWFVQRFCRLGAALRIW